MLLTHDDLDGVSCEVVAKQVFGRALKSKRTNYARLEESFLKTVEKNPERLIVTDLFPDRECPTLEALKGYKGNLLIFDHHVTSLPFIKSVAEHRGMRFCTDLTKDTGTKEIVVVVDGTSATKILANYYSVDLPMVEHVNEYDTTGTLAGLAGKLNILFYELPDRDMKEVLLRNPLDLSDKEEKIIRRTFEDAKNYFKQQKNTLDRRTIRGYRVAIMEAEGQKSFLYNDLLENNDYVILVDKKRNMIGFRGLEGCDKVAMKLGGGGHSRASGVMGSFSYDEIFKAWTEVLSA